MSKVRFMLLFLSFFSFLSLAAQDVKSDEEMKKEAQENLKKITEMESALEKMDAEAVKEKDIKWKVCLDNFFGALKGIAASAVNAAKKIPELIDAGKAEEANSQLVLLRGLTDSAERSFFEAQSCERQLSDLSQDSKVEKEVNKKLTGALVSESVSDAIGMNFGKEYVAELDKSSVSDATSADAVGADSSGGSDDLTQTTIVNSPEVTDVSPTE